MIFITGDTHGQFQHIEAFSQKYQTTQEDILIILGDVGVNYHLNKLDGLLKQDLDEIPLTFFCIHGNHEERPQNIPNYQEQTWQGGSVFVEPEHPKILFAKDGEVYDFLGKKTMVIGGAYSIDKFQRLSRNINWFSSEQPDETTKNRVETRLTQENWQVDFVLSHTCPYGYLPTEAFLSGVNQATVDQTTERWLGEIQSKLDYEKWFCGHFHLEKTIDRIHFLFQSIEEFH